MSKIQADIIFDTDCDFISEEQLDNIIRILLKDLASEIPEGIEEFSLLLTTDSAIQVLNKNYRNKDKATDVLSFPLLEGEGAEFSISLGDLVISLETSNRQAGELSLSKTERLVQLIIHGLLHLLGYDHENVSPEEEKRMQDREDDLFDLVEGVVGNYNNM